MTVTYLGRGGNVVRVRSVDREVGIAYVELVNGAVATAVDDDVHEWQIGDVLLVTSEEDRTVFTQAPPELWPHDGIWIGVVRLRQDDITVVEVGGTHRRISTNDVAYDVGNTVEGRDTGILRVLSKESIRYLDLVDRDAVEIEHFIHTSDDLPGFDDFGGLGEVKARARELIETPLKYRDALEAIRARPVRGVLFTGDPGTGKTMLARIIAGAADACFYQVSGPEIISKWHGDSEKVLRSVFKHAEEQDRSIIFFDEFDSIAVARSGDAHEASKRLVAQLLTLMDGFAPRHNVVVIAATNRPQDIDPALLRPGRFDWTIDFRLPDEKDRVAILSAQAKRLRTYGELHHAAVAARTGGWSGAELAAIFTEAALLAVVDERDVLMDEDYLGGFERVAQRRPQPQIADGTA